MTATVDMMGALKAETIDIGPSIWVARLGRSTVPNNEVPRVMDMLDEMRWKKNPEEPR